jgi:hypothetical protein
MSDKNEPKTKDFLSKVSGTLGILLGGGLAILSGFSSPDAKMAPNLSLSGRGEATTISSMRQLPPKLVLKPVGTGFRMIAASTQDDPGHSSHSSHSSHASHASHSSHVSGGFV